MYKIDIRPTKRMMHSLTVDVCHNYVMFNFTDINTSNKTYGEKTAYAFDTLSMLVINKNIGECELNGVSTSYEIEDLTTENAKRITFYKKTDDKITKVYEHSFVFTNLQYAHLKRIACELHGFATYLQIHDHKSHALLLDDEYLKDDYVYEDEEEDFKNIEYNKLTQYYGIDISLKNHRQLTFKSR